MMTSETCLPSTPARFSAASIATLPSSWAGKPPSAPLNAPTGVLAALTMSFGNILGLVQRNNVKRLLAYSSIAHTGYMLVGITALLSGRDLRALEGVLFYLASYGIMNVAAFGVLMLLPSRSNKPATSAETFDDIAGAGRRHPALGLAMAVACFSLTGLPLTIGFFGKFKVADAALWWGPTVGALAAAAGSFLPAWSARRVKVTEVFSRIA